MKKLNIFGTLAVLASSLTAQQQVPGYPISPVPFTAVKVGDGFWGQRLQASREVTIPLAFSKCEETGRYTNFTHAHMHLQDPTQEFPDKAWTFTFDDTDPYKTIEGASYLLQTYPKALYKGRPLVQYLDSVIAVIGSAQEPDGYLFTPLTKAPSKPHDWAGHKRWEKVEELSHEFYNLGHMLEGAVAHYQATGKRNFLDIAIRYADCVCREVGLGEGQVDRVPGHQIAEMGLVKLYLATGNSKYLEQAKYFLDRRGKTTRKDAYSQAHKPVIEQDEAVGHAVRAGYMYAGMADVAAITGDSAYLSAIDKIWDNIVSKKYYITGGIGARHAGEAFGDNYELPNADAYCETCAAIANVYVNHRLFLLHGETKYYDVVERTLYNALIAGVSLEGDAFFYPNPLASASDMNYARKAWFGCACCPSNISRFIPSLPGYVYAVKDQNIYVNLFMPNKATLNVGGKRVEIEQQTGYPYDGTININIGKSHAKEFALKVRIPGWTQGKPVPSDLYAYVGKAKPAATYVTINGKEVTCNEYVTEDGYLTLNRKWKKGDVVQVKFDMPVQMVAANPAVKDDRGMVSVERGPLVYCAEWPDNKADVRTYLLNPNASFTAETSTLSTEAGNNYGIVQVSTTDVQTLSYDKEHNLTVKKGKLTLIPYYAWDHRGQNGGMEVWIPVDVQAASATPRLSKSLGDNGFFNR
ncbi:MAG: glycoside hydrolase family 127 protein [Bacteroidales bacterium]|nr:glycoside hydrolase family 127 protein [Bacteroidales bacterium]